jgi:hypothetical protein
MDPYQLYASQIIVIIVAMMLLLLAWNGFLHWRLARLHERYREAMEGLTGVDLEAWLAEQSALQAEHAERILALEAMNETLQAQAGHAARVGMVRFNPFHDTGGDQSFAIAWIDEEANGVVVSSLYRRTGTQVYAKPLSRGDSDYPLTDEEQEAIKLARSRNGYH